MHRFTLSVGVSSPFSPVHGSALTIARRFEIKR